MKGPKSPFKRSSSGSKMQVQSPDQGQDQEQHSRNASGNYSGYGSNPPVSGNKNINVSSSHKRNTSRSSSTSQSSNFLAEQYDRDRKAIIGYCFSKNDPKTGATPNDYITHVRIIEDSKYPSSRPSNSSKMENKKKRILVLSSKASNKDAVQLHKGRENSDGSFQIGRTWDLKELIRIERDMEINEGFLLTMGKKYYWETNSAKERTVFIKFLVKVYIEVFEGHVPELIYWDLSAFYLDERSYQRAVIHLEKIQEKSLPNKLPEAHPQAEFQPQQQVFSQVQTQTQPQVQQRNTRQLPSIATTQPNSYDNSDDFNSQLTPRSSERKMRTAQPVQTIPSNAGFENNYHMNNSNTHIPPRNSLNKAPYSNSATINEVNRTCDTEQQGISQQRQYQFGNTQNLSNDLDSNMSPVDAYPSSIISSSAFESQSSLPRSDKYLKASAELLQSNVPNGQAESISQQSSSRDNYEGNFKATELYHIDRDVNDEYAPYVKHDNMLEDLNAVLCSTYENNDFKMNERTDVHHEQTYDLEASIIPLSIVDNGEDGDVVDLYDDYDIDEQRELDLNYPSKNDITGDDDEITEDLNELSYERGDEVRYSQIVEPPTNHTYHEVSTIQEEAPLVGSFNSMIDVNDKDMDTKRKSTQKKLLNIEDQALLEILTDVNWEIDDDADKLIERLNYKLAEVEYAFNNDLLALQGLDPTLSSYEKNLNDECQRINPTFSLFLMEMNNLVEDIEYVEHQNNGLQVESANKKLLWSTLTELLNTVSLDETALNELLSSPISERNLGRIELQLEALFNAIKAIEGAHASDATDLGKMQALAPRRQAYEKVTMVFLERVVQELGKKFSGFQTDVTSDDQLTNILNRMLIYSSLTSFCKSISQEQYSNIVEQWNDNIQPVYEKRFLKISKKLEAKITDVKDIQEETPMNLTLEQNFMKQWDEYKQTKKITIDIPLIVDVLSLFMDSITKVKNLCIVYQNFIDKFFHISCEEDFGEYLKQHRDPEFKVPSLTSLKGVGSDRASALIQIQLVSKVFQAVVTKISEDINSIFKFNKSIVPSILLFLEQTIKENQLSNQEFLLTVLSRFFTQVKQLWFEYIDDQVVYSERVVMNFSGKSIVPSVFTLPMFIKNSQDLTKFTQKEINITDMSGFTTESIVKNAFEKLSISVIQILSRGICDNNIDENSTERYDINKTITLLLNSHWLRETLPMINIDNIFEVSLKEAKEVFDNQKIRYAQFLLQESMPKLTSFVNGASNIIENTNANNAVNPSRWAVYSKQNLDNILVTYTSQEIDILVESLHKLMHSQYSKSINQTFSVTLTERLWSCIQGETVSLYLKLYTLIDKHYHGSTIKFSKNDIITAFDKYKK